MQKEGKIITWAKAKSYDVLQIVREAHLINYSIENPTCYYGRVAQLVRANAWRALGPPFESGRAHRAMKKEVYKKEKKKKIEEDIETTPSEDLWADFYEGSREALGKAMELLSHGFASVEISDRSIIYQTTVPSEVETLRSLEITPKKLPE